MSIQHARAMFIRDRMDWRKPHLNWVSSRLYRLFSE
jgi:hypothetical protein